jgi:hypothetical protein
VEERGGVRSRTSRVANPDTQRLGDRSFGRVDEKTVDLGAAPRAAPGFEGAPRALRR